MRGYDARRVCTAEAPSRRPRTERSSSKNARRNPDRQNARIESDEALGRVMVEILKDDAELFKLFVDTPSFKGWLQEMVFRTTYGGGTPP